MRSLFFAALLLPLNGNAFAALNVFACEPEWAALTQLLAGGKASIYTATTALQDPHQVEARPSLIARARRADLVICTGAELEAAWLPLVLRKSGNHAVQPGNPGYFEAASAVRLLETPARLDRAEGDVHALGNPHIQTDARNFLPVADALSKRLMRLDPANSPYYEQQLAAFHERWHSAIARWETEATPLRDVPIAVQHNGFPYLNNWLGLKQTAILEPKPGVEPSAAYLADLLKELQRLPVRMVVRAAYQDGRPSEWVAGQARIPAVVVPFTVGGTARATDLYSMFDDTIQSLLAGLK